MSALSGILRESADNGLLFWCPGCNGAHRIQHGIGSGPRWVWNGSVDKPTFSPSYLINYPANPDADENFKEWRTARVCHSFIADGRIQFLSDCTHALAGQTVDLPQYPGCEA